MSSEPSFSESEIKPIAKVGSANLVDYLTGKKETKDGQLRGDVDDFEKQIEVPEVMHQAIKEMYKKNGKVK